jgi:hypothetical protein
MLNVRFRSTLVLTILLMSQGLAGTIVDVSIIPGDHILSSLNFSEGSAIARIASMDDMIFMSKVDEDVVSEVSKGNEVQVKVSAYPEASFLGEVDEISLIAERDNGKAYFPLTVRLNGLNGYLMRIGSSEKSKIIFNKRANLLSKN